MAKFNQDLPQFGSAKPANTGGSQHCAQCEAMLADVFDGTLSASEQAQFDLHLAGCTSCSEMLADAQRGAAWLELLRNPRPEPPAALLDRILAQTIVQTSDHALRSVPGGLSIRPVTANGDLTLPLPASLTGTLHARLATVLPFPSRIAAAFRVKSIGPTMLQPRLAMTAAMAFFSIGLTLNLTGVRLNALRANDLTPSSLRRSFYQANAHVVRYYDNLRVVYELESRVRDLQHASESEAPAAPESSNAPDASDKKPADDQGTTPKNGESQPKQSRPRPGSGTSRRQGPAGPFASPSLAALYLPGTTASLPWRRVCVSSALVSTTSTLNEGKPV